VSNIGNIELPDSMAHMIERFDFVNGAPKKDAMNCGVVGYDDTISISFTSNISENSILKGFVDFLTNQGLEINVETNY
jgi:hypothetical protein